MPGIVKGMPASSFRVLSRYVAALGQSTPGVRGLMKMPNPYLLLSM